MRLPIKNTRNRSKEEVNEEVGRRRVPTEASPASLDDP